MLKYCDVKVAKKDNLYMFLITPQFKFLDVRNYLSYGSWWKANGCEMQKLVFPYEWLDDYKRLLHIRPVSHKAFYSKLKGNITCNEYNKFMQDFSERGCKTMMDWLKVYNKADVILFIEAVNKTCKQYYPDETDMLKDAVSIPGISVMYALNKSLKMTQPSESELFAPGQPCFHKCAKCKVDPKPCCEKCKKVRNDCTQCTQNKPYELLKTGMVGSASIVFCQYQESGKSRIHNYTNSKICSKIVGFDVNSLYLYCS